MAMPITMSKVARPAAAKPTAQAVNLNSTAPTLAFELEGGRAGLELSGALSLLGIERIKGRTADYRTLCIIKILFANRRVKRKFEYIGCIKILFNSISHVTKLACAK